MNRTLEIEVKQGEEDLEAGPVLSRHNKDSVTWTTQQDDFTICFNHPEKSPFKQNCFLVTLQQPADSGEVLPTANMGDYHYQILEGDQVGSCPAVGTKSPKVRIKT